MGGHKEAVDSEKSREHDESVLQSLTVDDKSKEQKTAVKQLLTYISVKVGMNLNEPFLPYCVIQPSETACRKCSAGHNFVHVELIGWLNHYLLVLLRSHVPCCPALTPVNTI